MDHNISEYFYYQLSTRRPQAEAYIRGSADFPGIEGVVTFQQISSGVLVTAAVGGLPVADARRGCGSSVFGLHIHEGSSCTGTPEAPFTNAGGHFNPYQCRHPHHAGDLPPLFSNGGFAWFTVLTGRFSIEDVIGRTVIIHRNPDDFTTQPSGNSGPMIACGTIQRV